MSTKLEIAKIIYESDYLDVNQKLKLIKEISGAEAATGIALTTTGTVVALHTLYRIRKRLADKEYRECVKKCDKQRIITGGHRVCISGCKIEYNQRMLKLKAEIKAKKKVVSEISSSLANKVKTAQLLSIIKTSLKRSKNISGKEATKVIRRAKSLGLS